MLEKFASRHPSCVSYDDKMQFYSQVADEVRRLQGVCVYIHIYVRTYTATGKKAFETVLELEMCVCSFMEL